MFDWLEFDKNVKKEYEEQTERLNAYTTPQILLFRCICGFALFIGGKHIDGYL